MSRNTSKPIYEVVYNAIRNGQKANPHIVIDNLPEYYVKREWGESQRVNSHINYCKRKGWVKEEKGYYYKVRSD